MSLLRSILLLVVFAGGVPGSGIAQDTKPRDEVDHTVNAGDDFYQYANGTWLKTATIPPGQSSFETRTILKEKTSKRVRDLIQNAAGAKTVRGSITQKVGDYFASFMDQGSIEARGFKPLADEMAKISAISTKESLAAFLGSTLNSEVDALVANADHVLGIWVNQGFQDSRHNFGHLWQGGLGMPDRDDYLDPSPKAAELRRRYQAHIAAILRLAGIADAEAKAARTLALEIRIAQSHAPDSDAADTFKQNNLWRRADFEVKAPGMNWDAYFKATGIDGQPEFEVWQPSAVIGLASLVGSEETETWKDYLNFHLIEHYAAVLPKAVAAEDAAFAGAQQKSERSDVAIAATNGALGQAVGQLYTERYFPPEAKAKAKSMVDDLIAAYRKRMANLAWMSAETKKKALAKLDALTIGVGYPDTWIDYSGLEVMRDDAFGNLRRAEAFQRARNLSKLKEAPDPAEWSIDPQIVGAIIMFSPNSEFFSAGILQPPFFDSEGDAASNYGSAGAGMAHEISHSFDELGNIYDAEGRLGNWWTEEDRAQYHAATAKLAAQLDRYCPLPNVCVKGKQVLGESVADLAGLLIAHDAYVLSLKGAKDLVIGGMTGEQRFFLAYAQRWRKIQNEDALRRQIATDTHLPAEYRSDAVRNVESWYKAFDVTSRDKLYLKGEDRVEIW